MAAMAVMPARLVLWAVLAHPAASSSPSITGARAVAYRLAKSLDKLRAQVNEKWPKRSKASDGWIGDTSHAARPSDHNPDSRGIVHAVDLTHDPANGFDSWKFADAILAAQDPRLKYVISNGRIGSGPAGPSPGEWRDYSGSNAHAHHCHISVVTVA